jgi:hypothetical protein
VSTPNITTARLHFPDNSAQITAASITAAGANTFTGENAFTGGVTVSGHPAFFKETIQMESGASGFINVPDNEIPWAAVQTYDANPEWSKIRAGVSPEYNRTSGTTLGSLTGLNSVIRIDADTYIGLPTADIASGNSVWWVTLEMADNDSRLEVATYSTGNSQNLRGLINGTMETATCGFVIPAGNEGHRITLESYDSGSSVYVVMNGTSGVSIFDEGI